VRFYLPEIYHSINCIPHVIHRELPNPYSINTLEVPFIISCTMSFMNEIIRFFVAKKIMINIIIKKNSYNFIYKMKKRIYKCTLINTNSVYIISFSYSQFLNFIVINEVDSLNFYRCEHFIYIMAL